MAVRSILRLGDPRLRAETAVVREFATAELRTLVGDMIDTMRASDGAGLAANQIGVLKRVVIFGFEQSSRYPEAEPVPFTVLINPHIEPVGAERTLGWEGCLSVPGMRGRVPRYSSIRYSGCDIFGAPIERLATGFHARVVQHESDHLDGILYPERIEDLRSFGFIEELSASGVLPDAARDEETAAHVGGG